MVEWIIYEQGTAIVVCVLIGLGVGVWHDWMRR